MGEIFNGSGSGCSPNSAGVQERFMPTQSMWAVKGLAMEKWLCWASMGIAGLLLLLFLLDLLTGIPFGGISAFVDILAILSCGVVLYLGWDAFKDLR